MMGGILYDGIEHRTNCVLGINHIVVDLFTTQMVPSPFIWSLIPDIEDASSSSTLWFVIWPRTPTTQFPPSHVRTYSLLHNHTLVVRFCILLVGPFMTLFPTTIRFSHREPSTLFPYRGDLLPLYGFDITVYYLFVFGFESIKRSDLTYMTCSGLLD